MSCRTQDAGWCEKVDLETAKEYLCPECDLEENNKELAKRNAALAAEQEQWKKLDQVRYLEVEALERKIKSLKADLDLWKNVSKHHYRKMVEAKIALKAEKDTSEFLRKEVARKDTMVER